MPTSTPWYGNGPNEPIPVPVLGPDLIDPRQAELFRREAMKHRETPDLAEALEADKPAEAAEATARGASHE